jgi:hypothetical protein
LCRKGTASLQIVRVCNVRKVSGDTLYGVPLPPDAYLCDLDSRA